MSKFAQYYTKFLKDNLFAGIDWKDRQSIFGKFLKDERSIRFSDKPIPEEGQVEEEAAQTDAAKPDDEGKKKVKIYKHKIYHLKANPDIVVMRLANVKLIPIEKDFKPEQVEHYPSLFIIIDNREGCRRVAIQKLPASFSNTDMVAKILQKAIGDAMMKQCNIGVEFRAQRYTKDFYELWRTQQHHTARIKFNISPDDDSRARLEMQRRKAMMSICKPEPKPEQKAAEDESIIGYIYQLQEESQKSGYRSAIEIEPEQQGAVMYVDEKSDYIRSLARYCSSTATPVEIITSDGATFECFIDSDMESDDKIVTQEFDAAYLEALFDPRLEEGTRKTYETKVVELLYSMKLVVDDDEKEVV